MTITDAEASHQCTLGDIHRLLVAKLSAGDTAPDDRLVWGRFCDVVVAEQGVPPNKLVPPAELGRDFGIH